MLHEQWAVGGASERTLACAATAYEVTTEAHARFLARRDPDGVGVRLYVRRAALAATCQHLEPER